MKVWRLWIEIEIEGFGDRLKEAIELRGIKQQDLANSLGLNRQNFNGFLNGDSTRVKLTLDRLLLLERLLRCELCDRRELLQAIAVQMGIKNPARLFRRSSDKKS